MEILLTMLAITSFRTTGAKMKAYKDSEKGIATIEILPLLIVFVILISYGLGLYGAIHTAILHSIAARSYAFHTFNFRADTSLFSDRAINQGSIVHYQNIGFRTHFIVRENYDTGDQVIPSERPIAVGRLREPAEAGGNKEILHNERVMAISGRNRNVEVDPMWIMVAYGLCIRQSCGGD